ncbi:hypothetical protein JO84_gp254 [Aureococcus anophagefferens virus]|uniref:Uncharacterized protein n=1 Tax=Aureococcus anophagefferens virus TaxID=1474867 RepID=A0A076FGM0_9VIRU|nr:hypothetical protein JO84_gp254 [Aureococcus anophagefferens virus]AII17235.1 hypothetical protein AaV_221 [Aureococcus anophagefferens virus]UOG94135.1 hypothetical protein MKD35_94 [Aureococcus anophagefferens virus]
MNFQPGKEFMVTEGLEENKESFLKRNKDIEEEIEKDLENIYYAGNKALIPNFEGYCKGIEFVPVTSFRLSEDKQSLIKITFKHPYKIQIATNKIFNGTTEMKGTGDLVGLYIEGETVLFRFHHLQLTSLYPNFNWLYFYQNLKRGNTITVDHLLKEHKRCHPNLLEVVPNEENQNRKKYFPRTEAQVQGNKKTGETNSKPVSLCDPNGNLIDGFEFQNAEKCAEAIYKEEYDENEIKLLGIKISNRLIGNTKPIIKGYEEYTYKYGKSYLDKQLPITYDVYDFNGTKWVLIKRGEQELFIKFEDLEPWRQELIKEDLKKYPESVAKSGRINKKTSKSGRTDISYGAWNKAHKSRMYNTNAIYKIMLYWFGTREDIEKLKEDEMMMICHNDGEFPHPCCKRTSENGEENSNVWGTFRVGTHDDNVKDRSHAKIREDKKKIEGHFDVFDKKGNQIGDRIFYSQSHFNLWVEVEKNGYKKFKNINTILKAKGQNFEHGLTFKKHHYD